VLYFVITGRNRPTRSRGMKAIRLAEQSRPALDRYSPALIEAIEVGARARGSARPADVATWRNALLT
jgi:hypothetical protein